MSGVPGEGVPGEGVAGEGVAGEGVPGEGVEAVCSLLRCLALGSSSIWLFRSYILL